MKKGIQYETNITTGARNFYSALKDNIDMRSWNNAKIASEFNVSRPTVGNWVRELERYGYIEREMVYLEGTIHITHRKIRLI